MVEFFSSILISTDIIKGISVVVFLLVSESLLWFSRIRILRKYETEKKGIMNIGDIEDLSSVYYRRRQILGIIRAITFITTVLLATLFYDAQTFGILALVLGAIVVIQKENINSLIAYFFVLSNFKVSDDIRIGDMLGEIVRVSPLQTILSGKENNGEYNGQKISIPNYKLIAESVQVQELRSNAYRRIVIHVVYEHGKYEVDFGEFLKRTRTFLDEFLPKRNLNQVGSFKSFVGMQYKINFDYDEAGRIVIRIAFISRPHDVVDRKEQIIEFMESLRSNSKIKDAEP